MSSQLVVACRLPSAVATRAATQFGAVLPGDADLTTDQALAALEQHQATALLFTSSVKLDAAAIQRLPARLRIAATSSVGYDHVDVAAAKARGLIVTNTPDVLTDATADLTLLLILGACRRAGEYQAIMREGWRRRLGLDAMLGMQVSGKRLGIIGMGRIGRAVAQRARGFGMSIHYYNRARLSPDLEQGAVYAPSIEALLPEIDILSLHAPGGAATGTLITAERLALLRRGAVLVNSARGSLIDEDALIAALRSGQLFAAGLDVFQNEPAFDLRFLELPNAFLLPHMGSATVETRNAMGNRALDNIEAVLAGQAPIDPLWT